MRTASTVLTMAGLTLREAARRRVVWALAALTAVLLGLSAWGFSRIVRIDESGLAMGTVGAHAVASELLNLVMFGLSLIAALGTAFLAGPTLAGEIESGMALAVLARPVRRWAVLLGKWLGLVAFGCSYVALAGLAQFTVVWMTTGYWPPNPVTGLALLAAETIALLSLGLLLSTVISPMASGIVAVGLFGATWVAGVVGGIGAAVGNDDVARIGIVSRILLPTDGLWRGAMHFFQDQSALDFLGLRGTGFPFVSEQPPTLLYLLWALVWVAMAWGLTALAFGRRDL